MNKPDLTYYCPSCDCVFTYDEMDNWGAKIPKHKTVLNTIPYICAGSGESPADAEPQKGNTNA